MKLIDLKNIVDRTISLSGRNKELKVAIPYSSEKGKFGGTPTIEVESVRQGIDWDSGTFFISPKVDIKEKTKQLFINGVSKSLNADELIASLGTPDVDNEYILKPDKHGTWQIEHKHVGSGEPLKQWLTGKP